VAEDTPQNEEQVPKDAPEAAAPEAPKRRRAAAKAPAEEVEATSEEKPKRRVSRPRAKAAAETDAAAEATPAAEGETAAAKEPAKPRRTRARAAAAAEEPTGEQASTEASEEEHEEEEEAPKPRRSRARAAAAEEPPAGSEPSAGRNAPAAKRRPSRARAARRPVLRRGRGGKAEPEREEVLVYATARYVRSSARKARLVCNHIRGKSVPEARAILAFAPRAVAKDWAKLLNSAVANAEHNFELIGDELRIKEAYADEGPTLKRFRPRAMGRATPIHKKTSHLSITLTQEA
jgi:ribosomal protein L22